MSKTAQIYIAKRVRPNAYATCRWEAWFSSCQQFSWHQYTDVKERVVMKYLRAIIGAFVATLIGAMPVTALAANGLARSTYKSRDAAHAHVSKR